VIHFPAGKGDPRWQQLAARGGLFLGIDHTAIVSGDTEASLRFWRDGLGLRVVGGSENWGTEQEHLNGVFGARLRITTLRAPAGPGVELLEYLSPRDGRPMPDDERASDLFHWQTRLEVADAAAAERVIRREHAPLVSPGVIDQPEAPLGFHRALLARDPDGHTVELAAP